MDLPPKQLSWQGEAGGTWEPVQQEAGCLRCWDLQADRGPVLDEQLEESQLATALPARRRESPDFCQLDLGCGFGKAGLGSARVWGLGRRLGCQEGLQCPGLKGLGNQRLPPISHRLPGNLQASLKSALQAGKFLAQLANGDLQG